VRNGQTYTIAAQLQDVNDNLKQLEVNWGEEQTTTKTVAAGQTQQAQVTASHTYKYSSNNFLVFSLAPRPLGEGPGERENTAESMLQNPAAPYRQIYFPPR